MSSSLPQRSLFGDCIFLAFLLVQFLDGALTYFGVRTYGAGIEANPIVGWYMAVLGVGGALIATKGLAVLCAALLHRFARHQILGVLTVVYLAAAVRPWVNLLTLMN
jgi:hypothetical protein